MRISKSPTANNFAVGEKIGLGGYMSTFTVIEVGCDFLVLECHNDNYFA